MKSLDNPFEYKRGLDSYYSDYIERDQMYCHRAYKESLCMHDKLIIGPGRIADELSLNYTGEYLCYLSDKNKHDVSVIDSRFNSLDVISNEEGLNARI
jgi:hypothetical protein